MSKISPEPVEDLDRVWTIEQEDIEHHRVEQKDIDGIDGIEHLEVKQEEDNPKQSSKRVGWSMAIQKNHPAFTTLWILIPLIVLIEVAMSLGLLIIPPDHPIDMVYFCAGCNIDADVSFASLATSSAMACIEDSILLVIGESFQTFQSNYLATMIGHLLTVYALVASHDASLPRASKHWSARLHFVSYILLIADFSVEMSFLSNVSHADPDDLDLHLYFGCDATPEREIGNLKEDLEVVALHVIIFRTVVGVTTPCLLCLSLSVSLSVSLNLCLSLFLSVSLSVSLSLCLSLSVSVCLCLSVSLSVSPSPSLSFSLSRSLSLALSR
jgi:hypothetical protein